ncbi:hypothetical protein FQR65_LT03060 [Abscondita terminalis]|nr:hypothetical protein FQR65_LT03060 [Abscondita terminalis]
MNAFSCFVIYALDLLSSTDYSNLVSVVVTGFRGASSRHPWRRDAAHASPHSAIRADSEAEDAHSLPCPPSVLIPKVTVCAFLTFKYGDRVAVIDFCRKVSCSIRLSLVEKLKAKIQENHNKPKNTKFPDKISISGHSLKTTRIIEIGWMFAKGRDQQYKQIRARHGGGTRREHTFDVNMIIQDMYEISHLTTLRFYLGTSYKSSDSVPEDDDMEHIPSTIPIDEKERQTNHQVYEVSNTVSTTDYYLQPILILKYKSEFRYISQNSEIQHGIVRYKSKFQVISRNSGIQVGIPRYKSEL